MIDPLGNRDGGQEQRDQESTHTDMLSYGMNRHKTGFRRALPEATHATHRTIMNRIGVKADSFGDPTGRLGGIQTDIRSAAKTAFGSQFGARVGGEFIMGGFGRFAMRGASVGF